MPKSNDPFDLINALENRYKELNMTACSDINAVSDLEATDCSAELIKQLIDLQILSESDIDLLDDLNECNDETLLHLLYVRTGYDDIDQYIKEVYSE